MDRSSEGYRCALRDASGDKSKVYEDGCGHYSSRTFLATQYDEDGN